MDLYGVLPPGADIQVIHLVSCRPTSALVTGANFIESLATDHELPSFIQLPSGPCQCGWRRRGGSDGRFIALLIITDKAM